MLRRWRETTDAVGIVACVADRRGIAWRGGIGDADLDRTIPLEPDTSIVNVASVSKLVTATVVLQLVTAGRLELDASVDDALGIALRHPAYPDDPITARQLLTHSSAIADGPAYGASYAPGDPTVDLRTWLTSYFVDGGSTDLGAWHPWRPGARYRYSNVGYGVLGLLVEAVDGKDLRACSRDSIFEPLGMSSSGWFLSDVDPSCLATVYDDDGDSPLRDDLRRGRGRWVPLVPYGFPNYPDGLLRTTAVDLGRFAASMLDGAETAILPHATVESMMRPHVVDGEGGAQGLGWRASSAAHAETWGHDGADPGVASLLVLDRDRSIATVLLSNSAIEMPSVTDLIEAAAATARRSRRSSP